VLLLQAESYSIYNGKHKQDKNPSGIHSRKYHSDRIRDKPTPDTIGFFECKKYSGN